MIELGLFHNGTADRPAVMSKDGCWVFDGTLGERNTSTQRETVSQVREGVLADQLGFNYFFMTEHHFQPEGAEHSPNPLLTETAIAAQTRRIRLGQIANILTWHHPIRLAEQAAMLDVLSGGRLEFGVARGYQPRETEVLGGQFGATAQDQERNRAYFEEAYELIMTAWTQESFSFEGEFFTIPPTYTKWNHSQTIAYFKQPQTQYELDRVLNLGEVEAHASGPRLMGSTTTLRELQLFPRPLQEPHPQVWQPVSSPRSIVWAAKHGVNCYGHPEHVSRLQKNMQLYYEECEQHDWPDRLNRGPFKLGWDAEKRRGYPVTRYVHLLDPRHPKEDLARFETGVEMEWDNHEPFGFAALSIAAVGEKMDPYARVTGALLTEREVIISGTPDEVVEKILRLKEGVGYEDFLMSCWFENSGYASEETQENMRWFAADCMPQLAEACGGMVVNPELGLALTPTAPVPER